MIKEKVRAANKYSVSTLNDVRSHLTIKSSLCSFFPFPLSFSFFSHHFFLFPVCFKII